MNSPLNSLDVHLAVLTAALSLGLSVASAAQTWHVTGLGSDTAAGTSPAAAFRTIKRAATQVQDSGTDDVAQTTDRNGGPRPIGKARDRGAYEQ